MRSEAEVLGQLLEYAQSDDKVRAVLLNGSRVNPNVTPDELRDYDVIYAVTDPGYYVQRQEWIRSFGELIVMQQNTIRDRDGERYIFLMQFMDGVRIDLSFRPADKIDEALTDSLTKVLLDKDGAIGPLPEPNDSSYVTRRPAAGEFEAAMNEIWWCSANVAKGLLRRELPYAKYMLDVIVRECLVKALTWYVGMRGGWSVNSGKAGRWLERQLPAELWQLLVCTYAGADYEAMWDALQATGELTRRVGVELAEHLGCRYPLEDDSRVTAYLQRLRSSGRADTNAIPAPHPALVPTLRPIAQVESTLVDRAAAPKQGDEGAPDAWLVFEPGLTAGLRDLRAGDEAIVLTWLDRARRDVLTVRPRGDAARPETGVFSTRSPDRPNPIGLHRVTIVAIEGARLRVRNLEALDGTPVIDVKPVLDQGGER